MCAGDSNCFAGSQTGTPAFKSRIRRSLIPGEDEAEVGGGMGVQRILQDTFHLSSWKIRERGRGSKFVKMWGDKVDIVEVSRGAPSGARSGERGWRGWRGGSEELGVVGLERGGGSEELGDE